MGACCTSCCEFIDRNGNISSVQMDPSGLPKKVRVFTNRNVRNSDPELYETRFEHDSAGETLSITTPRGNELLLSRDSAGNTTEIRRREFSGQSASSDLVTTMAYEPDFNALIRVTPPRGNAPDVSPAQRDFFTVHMHYDHMDRAQQELEASAIFGTVLSEMQIQAASQSPLQSRESLIAVSWKECKKPQHQGIVACSPH